MNNPIIEQLKQKITAATLELENKPIGHIVEIGDGIARIEGLSKALSQEMLLIETAQGDYPAIALNLEQETIGAMILGNDTHIREGDTVKSTGQVLSIPVGEELIGRVINPLGEPLDDQGPINQTKLQRAPIEQPAPTVLMRSPVDTPLHTGIKAIDAMIPIGRGQRELIIGDRQIGKTSIAIDTIINQKNEPNRPVCIYVAIGQREAKIAKIIQDLREHGALEYTIIVAASASSPAALWYLAPYAGATIGEYFMRQGKDALVVYDDLSKHASAYRQVSLLLRRPPGREAYPGDIFYLHSRLLERAAKLSETHGGGSLTALPIIETQLGDVAAYIPTNVISITDGQIYLEPDLFYQGVKPAINIGLSVSRVGSAAQTKAMKKVAGRLRLELAQFRELQAFSQFASDLDEATKKKIARGTALTEILKQVDLQPLVFEDEVVSVWVGINGYADTLPVQDVAPFVRKFVHYVRENKPQVIETIRTKKMLTDEIEIILRETLEIFQSLT